MEPGETFGKYVLVRRLATGGMADIYLARQSGVEGFQKPCVIKRILPQLADDQQFVNMFLDEARIAALLTHPNIVQIFDLGKQDGSYFLAMEHIHGEDLTRILDAEKQRGNAALPLPVATRIISQVAEGLDYAHHAVDEDGQALGIVHRDVSPPNVIVSYAGSVKIVDFGIAKAAVKHTRTEVGVIKGKVPYMSPEQVQGLDLDQRSDIFSLGALLYELATGGKPFAGDNVAQLCMQIVANEPAVPVGIPQPLSDLILRCLSKRPEERFQSAGELAQALEHQGGVASSQQMATYMRELFPVQARQSLPPGMKTPVEKTAAQSPRAKSAPIAFELTMQMDGGSEPKPMIGTDVRKAIRDDEPTILDPRFAGRDSLDMEAGGREALEKSLRNLRRGRSWGVALFLVILGGGGGAGYWWWQKQNAAPPPVQMPDASAADNGEKTQRRPRADAAAPTDALPSLIDAGHPRRRPEPPTKARPLHEPPKKVEPKDTPLPRAVPPPEPAEPKPEAHLPKDDPPAPAPNP